MSGICQQPERFNWRWRYRQVSGKQIGRQQQQLNINNINNYSSTEYNLLKDRQTMRDWKRDRQRKRETQAERQKGSQKDSQKESQRDIQKDRDRDTDRKRGEKRELDLSITAKFFFLGIT